MNSAHVPLRRKFSGCCQRSTLELTPLSVSDLLMRDDMVVCFRALSSQQQRLKEEARVYYLKSSP